MKNSLRRQSLNHQTAMRAMSSVTLARNTNQARGLAEYAIEFMKMDNKKIADEVYDRV